MNEEKSTLYVAPDLEIVEVAVERGFAGTDRNGTEDYGTGVW